MSLIISDACPIQLWPIGCNTWNESTTEGMIHKNFCLPVNCDDMLRIDMADLDSDDNYDLVFYNNLNQEIARLNFNKTTVSTLQNVPGLDDFENESGVNINWAEGDVPHVTIPPPSGASNKLSVNQSLSAGTYQVNTVAAFSGAGTLATMKFYNGASEIESITLYSGFDSSPKSKSTTINLGVGVNKFSFAGSSLSASTRTITIQSYSIYRLTYLYYVSFTPSDLGICDEEVYVKVIRTTGTPDVELYKSDGLDVKTSHSETKVITYSNHRNYAGLYYSNVSPDQVFSIRIPATFIKTRFPQTQETLQLSSNRVISLNSQIRVQKFLSTGKMPYYMHLKMSLILAHQIILIDQEYYVNEEGYERIEPADPKDTLERYQSWLTKKDYVVRNIL